jgi:hypothetical protein
VKPVETPAEPTTVATVETPAPADEVAVTAAPPPAGTRFGALVDVMIDGHGDGAAVTPGLSVRLGDRLEIDAKALISGSAGMFVGGTVYLATGTLRPQVSAGLPIFFSDGARLGLRGGAGVSYELGPRFSLVGEVGADYFVNPEPNRRSFVLVPLLGAHARL